jgi:hypothetical protein
VKKKALITTGSFFCLYFILLLGESVAGVVVEQIVRDPEGMASRVDLYYSGARLRTDRPARGMTTVMDFKEDRLILIDHRSKWYVEVILSQWKKEMADRLKKERLNVKSKKRKLTLKKTAEKRALNGFQTEKVQILADGELIEEDWVTLDVDLKEIDQVMEKVARGDSSNMWLESKEGGEGKEIYGLVRPHGFPILVKDYGLVYGLSGIDVLEVKRITREDLKDEVFAPPADYRRVLPSPPGR